MAFLEHEEKIFKAKRNAVDRMDDYLNSLPDAERDAAINIAVNASQKRAMDVFRQEGYPISWLTLTGWLEKHNVV